MQLSGAVTAVTGGGQGIGRGIALRLASLGSDVAVLDKNIEAAETVSKEVERLGRRALAIQLDVSRCALILPAVERVIQEFGKVDIWVNNAGIVQTKSMLDITEDDWDNILDTNAKGTFFCTQAIARHMIQRRSGLIVNLTSGQRARPMAAPYAASKMAVDNITMTAALALAPYEVRVNAIDPNIVRTAMWKQLDDERVKLFGLHPGEATRRWESQVPLGKLTSPEQIGGIVAFLASDDAAIITGQIVRSAGASDLATFEKAQETDPKH